MQLHSAAPCRCLTYEFNITGKTFCMSNIRYSNSWFNIWSPTSCYTASVIAWKCVKINDFKWLCS